MIDLQLNLFLLILIGMILKRRNIITDAGQKCLSDLTVNIILPCNIIASFMKKIEISAEFLQNCTYAFVIALAIQVFSILAGKYFFYRIEEGKRHILTYGLIVSNSSFIGIPVIQALYGTAGVLYTSIFQIPVRITMWSSGLALFTDVDKKDAFKKLLRHPCILAVVIGIFLMCCPIKLPAYLDNTVAGISKCTVPVSMLAIGSMLSESRWRQFFQPEVLYYCLIRLAVYPLLTLCILRLLGADMLLTNVTVLLTAMPMANTTAILADKYHYNSMFASQTILVSTFLSMITLPAISQILAC